MLSTTLRHTVTNETNGVRPKVIRWGRRGLAGARRAGRTKCRLRRLVRPATGGTGDPSPDPLSRRVATAVDGRACLVRARDYYGDRVTGLRGTSRRWNGPLKGDLRSLADAAGRPDGRPVASARASGPGCDLLRATERSALVLRRACGGPAQAASRGATRFVARRGDTARHPPSGPAASLRGRPRLLTRWNPELAHARTSAAATFEQTSRPCRPRWKPSRPPRYTRPVASVGR